MRNTVNDKIHYSDSAGRRKKPASSKTKLIPSVEHKKKRKSKAQIRAVSAPPYTSRECQGERTKRNLQK